MSVNPDHVDLNNIEDVTDIEPEPTLAASDSEHRIGSIGLRGKTLLIELLAETPDDEPMAERVFERLGEEYAHAEFEDYDVFWAEDEDSLVESLEEWESGRSF